MNLSVIWRFLLGACQIIYMSELEVKVSGMIMIKMLGTIKKKISSRVTRGVGFGLPCF